MADPFVAEIRIFPFKWAPKGWAWCDGQLLSISQNTALFSLLGTTYGGNGITTFALPNLDGRLPVHQGQGPGLSLYVLGEVTGVETVTLTQQELPSHPHSVSANINLANLAAPSDKRSFAHTSPGQSYIDTKANPNPPLTPFAAAAIGTAGGSLPHNNMMPYLTLYFAMALQGVYPPRC